MRETICDERREANRLPGPSTWWLLTAFWRGTSRKAYYPRAERCNAPRSEGRAGGGDEGADQVNGNHVRRTSARAERCNAERSNTVFEFTLRSS